MRFQKILFLVFIFISFASNGYDMHESTEYLIHYKYHSKNSCFCKNKEVMITLKLSKCKDKDELENKIIDFLVKQKYCSLNLNHNLEFKYDSPNFNEIFRINITATDED